MLISMTKCFEYIKIIYNTLKKIFLKIYLLDIRQMLVSLYEVLKLKKKKVNLLNSRFQVGRQRVSFRDGIRRRRWSGRGRKDTADDGVVFDFNIRVPSEFHTASYRSCRVCCRGSR